MHTAGCVPQVYRKKNGMAGAIPFKSKQIVLEDEPDDKLDHASALLFGGLAEVRIGLSELSRHRVLLELQRQIGVVWE